MYTLKDLIEFLNKLYEKKIKFKLNKIRDSILIEVSITNQMWEIEFMQDGTIEIEKYISNGERLDEKEVKASIEDWSEVNIDQDWPDKLSLFELLDILEKAKIYYLLDRDKEYNCVSVIAVVPGQKWRIKCFSDGKVEIEKFLSNGDMFDEKEIEIVFKQLS